MRITVLGGLVVVAVLWVVVRAAPRFGLDPAVAAWLAIITVWVLGLSRNLEFTMALTQRRPQLTVEPDLGAILTRHPALFEGLTLRQDLHHSWSFIFFDWPPAPSCIWSTADRSFLTHWRGRNELLNVPLTAPDAGGREVRLRLVGEDGFRIGACVYHLYLQPCENGGRVSLWGQPAPIELCTFPPLLLLADGTSPLLFSRWRSARRQKRIRAIAAAHELRVTGQEYSGFKANVGTFYLGRLLRLGYRVFEHDTCRFTTQFV